jgi:four helix bundle protein
MSVQSYRDLRVWQNGLQFTKLVYQIAASPPLDERYGLSSQMKRSAVSVPTNICEGHSRSSQKEFVRFLNIAYASLAETENLIILANEFKMVSSADCNIVLEKAAELGRMINALKRSILLTDDRRLTTDDDYREVV